MTSTSTVVSGDMISQEALPENLVTRCLDILRKLSPNERDLIRVVVEVVHELRDPSDPDDGISCVCHIPKIRRDGENIPVAIRAVDFCTTTSYK